MIIKNTRYNILLIRIERLDLGKIISLSLEIFKKFNILKNTLEFF